MKIMMKLLFQSSLEERLTPLDEDNLLLSTGEFRYRKKAQDLSSIFGKIININLDNGEYNIVSMGHRNPQGLFVDQNKIVLSTEHGPWGGDEINLIPFEKIYNNEILNFGWPISSYGEHYAKKKNARTGEALRRVDLLYKNILCINLMKSMDLENQFIILLPL